MQLKDAHLFRQQAYIDGVWLDADSGQTIAVNNPASGEIIGSVPKMGRAETRRAIEAAERALPAWSALTAKERASKLRRWFELMMENQDDLGRLMTIEQGKPLSEAKGEIAYAASFLEWFAEEAKRVYGDTIPGHQPDKRIIVLKQPIGVTAAITPWNFPSAMITRKAGPALAAGCTMVLKPASQTPYSALALAALAEKAGIPPGVFSVVTGSASEVGSELTGNPIVRKLTFTGSTPVGRHLARASADTFKKLSLELGGNAPFIVFEDADLDAAVDGLMAAKFRNAGQTCVCPNRVYVHDAVHEDFVARLAARVAALRVAPATDPQAQIGPLINAKAVDKVDRHVQDALAKGATLVTGGKRLPELGVNFYQPTVLTDAGNDMEFACEETFGPMVPVFRFVDEDAVVAEANGTPYGLAAYFYTRDVRRIARLASALEAGLVGINEGAVASEAAPFGGIKASGYGREGSRHGLDEYMHIKYLCQGGLN